MSAAPVYPSRRPVRQAPPRRRRPAKRRQRRAAGTGAFVANLAFFGISLFAVSFGFSSLLGHSMMEHARHEANRAVSRAKSAKGDVAKLSKRWDRLFAMKTTDDWSRANGFVPPYVRPEPAKVAQTQPAPPKLERHKPVVDIVAVNLGSRNEVR